MTDVTYLTVLTRMAEPLDNEVDCVTYRNARIFTKKLLLTLSGILDLDSVRTEMLNLGMDPHWVGRAIADLTHPLTEENFEIDKMGWNDGPGLGPDIPVSEGVYECIKEAIRHSAVYQQSWT